MSQILLSLILAMGVISLAIGLKIITRWCNDLSYRISLLEMKVINDSRDERKKSEFIK